MISWDFHLKFTGFLWKSNKYWKPVILIINKRDKIFFWVLSKFRYQSWKWKFRNHSYLYWPLFKIFFKAIGLTLAAKLGWEFLCDFERPSRFLSEKISNKKKCYLRRGCGWKIYFAQLCLNLIFRKLTVCWNKSIQMNLIIHFISKIENIWFSKEK